MSTRREFLLASGASLAPAVLRGAGRPNILLMFPDQHRHDWVAGDTAVPVRTPNLDALAARGARFRNAVTPSPLCAPARACLAAGMEYDRCRVPSNAENYPLDQPTFYQMLRESGYHVTGCGKFDLHKGTEDWGLDGKRLLKEWGYSDGIDNAGKFDAIRSGATQPKDPYMAYLHRRDLAAAHVADFRRRQKEGSYFLTEPTPLPDEAYCDNWVGKNGLDLLARAPKGKPWFLMANFTGPHNPVDITASMDKICRGRDFRQPVECTVFTTAKHVAIRQNYSAMVENIDRWLGLYIEQLRRRRELDNTLIAFSSDHGEMLGDHDRWGKTLPYHPSVGVPLVLAGPGVERGIDSKALVSVMDLAATFLDCAQVKRPGGMDSRSLAPLLSGKAKSHREFVRSGLGQWRMVSDGSTKLVRGFDPARRRAQEPAGTPAVKKDEFLLFDLTADPDETRNVASERRETVERLAKLM